MNKYNAKKTVYNGDVYHSKKEAAYAKTLDMLKKSTNPKEKVLSYRRQVPFPAIVEKKNVCTYKLDFLVTYADGRIEHIDVKGFKTPVYRIKKKLIEALYGITILER